MFGRTRDHSERPRSAIRRAADKTDYEHRYFVNLAATAFVLALGLLIGWTVKAFDSHLSLEKCLDSGRKECRQVTEPANRGVLVLRKF